MYLPVSVFCFPKQVILFGKAFAVFKQRHGFNAAACGAGGFRQPVAAACRRHQARLFCALRKQKAAGYAQNATVKFTFRLLLFGQCHHNTGKFVQLGKFQPLRCALRVHGRKFGITGQFAQKQFCVAVNIQPVLRTKNKVGFIAF